MLHSPSLMPKQAEHARERRVNELRTKGREILSTAREGPGSGVSTFRKKGISGGIEP